MGKDRGIVQRLEFDADIHLDYGVPIPTIPYKQISKLLNDGTNTDVVMQKAYDLVEQEKDNGKPGAFVTLEYDEKLNTIVKIWSWQD